MFAKILAAHPLLFCRFCEPQDLENLRKVCKRIHDQIPLSWTIGSVTVWYKKNIEDTTRVSEPFELVIKTSVNTSTFQHVYPLAQLWLISGGSFRELIWSQNIYLTSISISNFPALETLDLRSLKCVKYITISLCQKLREVLMPQECDSVRALCIRFTNLLKVEISPKWKKFQSLVFIGQESLDDDIDIYYPASVYAYLEYINISSSRVRNIHILGELQQELDVQAYHCPHAVNLYTCKKNESFISIRGAYPYPVYIRHY